jgi:hypothetical protein
MRVAMASSAGHPDRPNEDFVGAVPGAVVLLDGAGIPGSEVVCRHGVGWYVQSLGHTLLGQLFSDPGLELAAALGASIEHVAELHRPMCDIASPISPQASVAVVRFADDFADYLVLADAFVVVDLAGAAPQVVTDPREVQVRRECTSVLRGLSANAPEYEQVLLGVTDAFRQQRNRQGGFWVAKDDSEAATQAVTGRVPLERVHAVALLSNGASRIVMPYQLAEWPAVMDLARTAGPHEVLRRVRAAESGAGDHAFRSGVSGPDDATVAFCAPVLAAGPASSSAGSTPAESRH